MAKMVVITQSPVPSEQLRAVADHIGDPSPPSTPATETGVEDVKPTPTSRPFDNLRTWDV